MAVEVEVMAEAGAAVVVMEWWRRRGCRRPPLYYPLPASAATPLHMCMHMCMCMCTCTCTLCCVGCGDFVLVVMVYSHLLSVI